MSEEPDALDGEPVTEYESKMVMIRGERGDKIELGEFGTFEIVQRTLTYYGPKFILDPDNNDYPQAMLTAPGPASKLQLWFANTDEKGFVTGWSRMSTVSGELVEHKKYDICACGEPLKTEEHRMDAALGIGEHE